MGMFDTVVVECPLCKYQNEFQSKYGDCTLETYTIENAPLLLIADLNDDGKKDRLLCGQCFAKLEVIVQFMVTVKVKGDNTQNELREV